MHDWQSWAIPAVIAVLIPIVAAIWRGGERLTRMEQNSDQHRTELNTHAKQIEMLDSRLDGQITTLYRVEGKLDALLEGFKSLFRFSVGPPKP